MAFDPDEMLARKEAVERVQSLRGEALEAVPTESVPLDVIAGRTVAEPVVAERDLPPNDYATMDGFAFDASQAYPLSLVEEVFPEDDPPAIEAGEAVKIATGAPLPSGANAVLKREDATPENGELSGIDIEPGTYVYGRGSNVAAGERLFEPGERLGPKDAILLRDIGVEEVRVHERLSAGVLATGTEIHQGRHDDLDSPMLAGLVRSWGHEATYEGTVPDDFEWVVDRLDDLATTHDVVITTGGTSVGKKDYVIRALDELGEVAFHGVRLRPGKPIAVAALRDHDAIAFAIPGKPVGALTVATLVMRPFFAGGGLLPTVEATLDRRVGIGRPGFEYVVPVLLDDGRAMPLGHVDSPLQVYEETFNASVLSSSTRATRADGFFVTDEDTAAGEPVEVVPYPVVE